MLLKDVDQEPRTLIIFNLLYGTNELRKRPSFNFDAIGGNNVIQPSKDLMLVASILKAFDDVSTYRSVNAIERDGLGHAPCPIDALPWNVI